MKTKQPLRILLDLNSQSSIDEMLENLKNSGEFVKINHSKLASWIINKFKTEMFERHKAQIIQEHFNSKEYLINLATKVQNTDDASEMLEIALRKIQKRSAKPNVKKDKQMDITNDRS